MLQYRQHRYGTEFNELRRYADWLGAEAAHLEAEHSPTQTVDFALHYQRVLLNYVVTVENLVSVAGHEPDTSTSTSTSTSTDASRAKERALELVRLIDTRSDERAGNQGELHLLDMETRLVAATGYDALGGSPDLLENGGRLKEATISPSPWVRYDLGCMYYAQSEEQTNPTRKAQRREPALENFENAVMAPRPLTVVWKDTMLARLRPYRWQFAGLGITSPLRLSNFVGSRAELGKLSEQERDLLSTKVFRALEYRYQYEEFDFLRVAGWVDSLVP